MSTNVRLRESIFSTESVGVELEYYCILQTIDYLCSLDRPVCGCIWKQRIFIIFCAVALGKVCWSVPPCRHLQFTHIMRAYECKYLGKISLFQGLGPERKSPYTNTERERCMRGGGRDRTVRKQEREICLKDGWEKMKSRYLSSGLNSFLVPEWE